MTLPAEPKIAFLASSAPEAQAALAELTSTHAHHQPEDADDDAVPRMAVQVSSVPVRRHAIAAATEPPGPERDRLARKNRYRLLKRFATRRDLLVAGDRETEGPVAERPERPAAFRRQRP